MNTPALDPPAAAPAAPDAQPANGGGEASVPYSRFQAVVAARNDLAGRVEALTGEVQTLSEKAATVDSLAGQLADAQGRATTAESRYQTFREISGVVGVRDPDVVELIERTHGKLPAEGRPSIGAWLGSLRETPDTAPAVLRPFIGDAAPTPTLTAAPRAPAAGSTPPGAPSSVSAEAIRAAKDEGVRTGDWSRYKDLATAAGYRR